VSFNLPKSKALRERLSGLIAPVAYWPRALQLIWSAAPKWTTAWLSLLVVQGVLPTAQVYLTKVSIDSLIAAKNAHGSWPQLRRSLIWIIVTATVMLLTELVQGMIDWIKTAQSEYVQNHIKDQVHKQSTAVELSFYESPEYYDRLEQAQSEAGTRPLALLDNFGSVLQNGLTLIGMAVVLSLYGWWLPITLLVTALPAFYVVMRFDREHHKWWQKTTATRRHAQYYDLMLTSGSVAAELRLFGLGPTFQSFYQKLRLQMLTERLQRMRRQSLARFAANLMAFVVAGLVLGWIFWRAVNGFATLGDLALFYQAFSRGQGLMRTLLSSVGQVYANSLYLGNLFTFLDLKASHEPPSNPIPVPKRLQQGIEFKNVSFGYPGSERPALTNFNLKIPANRIIAIVGANGAGKSTLLKLLCHFYDPQKGRIEIDGIDVRDMAMEDLWRRITVLFQFPFPYYTTVARNIGLGDLTMEPSAEQIQNAARAAGAHRFISRLPQGYETQLGKWFTDGVELSGGEWQRLSMARAYIRQAPIILLDEPTSFMDSWDEADWFERFRSLAEGRTAIIITHRFTIAMRTDIIHVMADGEIVESGTHEELLTHDGLYAQSWEKQMRTGDAHLEETGVAPNRELFLAQPVD
jgi:ATP-binding cassette, subfamily B, bacterial